MRYKETREQSAELLRQVLALMGQHDAAFNPVSFAVWYEFAAGINPRLTQGVRHAIELEPRLGDAALAHLYQEFVAQVDPIIMQRISTELQHMMTDISDSALRTGEHAGAFGRQLNGLTAVLQSNDTSAMSPMVQQALVGTAQMKSSVEELAQQVAAGRQEIERLQVDLVRARDDATLDPLTKILNRKGFDEQLALMLQQPLVDGEAHCLIMLDIDHFKKVNDTHGHVMGDRVIQVLGEVLRSCVSGQSQSVARYGGEEFAVLLSHSTLDEGMKVAELVRKRTKAMKIRDRRTQEVVLTVTISGGLTSVQQGDDADALIARADGALYRSKQAGRDRITCA